MGDSDEECMATADPVGPAVIFRLIQPAPAIGPAIRRLSLFAARPPPPRPPGGRRRNAAAGAPTAAASRGGSGLPQRDSGRQNGSPAADRSGWAVRRAGQNPASGRRAAGPRSEEHTSELQSLMRISYAVFCLKKTKEDK